jgi:hypothetical protein
MHSGNVRPGATTGMIVESKSKLSSNKAMKNMPVDLFVRGVFPLGPCLAPFFLKKTRDALGQAYRVIEALADSFVRAAWCVACPLPRGFPIGFPTASRGRTSSTATVSACQVPVQAEALSVYLRP